MNYNNPKRSKKPIFIGIACVIFLALIGHILTDSEAKEPKAPVKQTNKELIQVQFNGLTGSHYKLEQIIKETMNDASSYEHVKTQYIIDTDTTIYITTSFRGTNALGAKIINTISARYGIHGSLIEIIK